MQRTYGAPEVKETCNYKPVDIHIEDLYDLNWNHWLTGYKKHNKELDNIEYYIYSILGGIVFMRFNEENRAIVKEFVEKQSNTRFNEAYLAWYAISHGEKHKTYNVAKEAKVPFFKFNERRIAKTIDAELAADDCMYEDTTFTDIATAFMNDVKEALAKNDKESVRETHNKFTSYMINHIICVDCDERNIFVYDRRKVTHKDPKTGEEKEMWKPCNEIHFIVTYEITSGGKTTVQKKTMPTLPLITGGGKQHSTWTIENILRSGRIIGLMETSFKIPDATPQNGIEADVE